MTAPSAGRDDATVRGAVVLVVAIILGLALLTRGGGGGDDDGQDASSDRSTESTATTAGTGGSDSTTVPIADDTSSTTAPTDDPSSTVVAVLNATPQGGWAAENAATIASADYMTVEGNFGGEDADVSLIYATPEAQSAAQAVAGLLGLQVQVAEKPAEPLGDEGQDADADVVVVLGADSLSDG